jgi:hypothetical protein
MFKFASIRNPWDRMISFYFSPHRRKVSWNRDHFIKSLGRIKPVSAYLALEERGDTETDVFKHVDYFVRFESLNHDFKRVCDLIGIPWMPLPVRNKSNRNHYTRYYDDELIELVRDTFSQEINYFGYQYEK